MTYGKLENGYIRYAPKTVTWQGHIVNNPDSEKLKELGYLPIRYVDMPTDAPEGKHYESSWEQTETEIVQTWTLVEDEPVPEPPPTIEEQIAALQRALINQKIVGGGITNITDSSENKLKDIKLFGKSEQTQDPPPSPENPQPIRNVGKYNEGTGKYEIGINVSGRNIFDMDYILDDNMLNSNYNKSVEIKPFKVRKGHKYLLITKGLNYNNSYSAIIFGELDLKYLKLETYVLYFGQNKSFSENKQVRKVVEATRDCLITNVIVHGSNNFDNAYEVKEFGVFEISESDNTENILYESYREQQSITLTSDRPLTKWDKLIKQDGVYGWMYGGKIIESYNSEPIDTEYMSSTGELSVDATVLYKLKEAEFVPLSDEEQRLLESLSTYYPTTVITVDGGEVDADVEITYTADTKNYIDNQIKAVTGKQIETNKLILERMI